MGLELQVIVDSPMNADDDIGLHSDGDGEDHIISYIYLLKRSWEIANANMQ